EVDAPSSTPALSSSGTRDDVALPDLALALLVAAIVLVPIAVGTVAWSAPGGGDDFNRRITLQLFDLGLVLVGCARIAVLLPRVTWRDAVGAVRRRAVASALSLAITVLGVTGVVAFAVH